MQIGQKLKNCRRAYPVQSEEHVALDLEVGSLSPTLGSEVTSRRAYGWHLGAWNS